MTISPQPQSQPTPAGEPTRTLTFHSPEDVLAYIPVAMGFQPTDSVVLFALGCARPFYARVDLPTDDAGRTAVCEALVGPCRRLGNPRAGLAIFTDDREAAAAMADDLADALEEIGVEVVVEIGADGTVWWDLEDPACVETPYDISTHAFLADSVLEGRVVQRDRAALAAEVQRVDHAALPEVERAAAAHAERSLPYRPGPALRSDARWVRDQVRRWTAQGSLPTHEEAGRLVSSLTDIRLRDVAWNEIDRRSGRAHVTLWLDVVSRTPADLVAAPATLLAFAAWMAGDGALAWCAVERALDEHPGYSMALLMADTLQAGLPPDTWTSPPVSCLTALRGR